MPKKSSLYLYRINLDLATMLFARSHRFSLATTFYVHCRLDASLQYGRDYFMSEVDIVYPSHVKTWKDLALPGVLYTRLLVGQTLGARSSSATIKTKKLLHQLALDSCLIFLTLVTYTYTVFFVISCRSISLFTNT